MVLYRYRLAPGGTYIHTYHSLLYAISPCLAVDLVKLYRVFDRVKVSVVKNTYEFEPDGSAIECYGVPSGVSTCLQGFKLRLGPQAPVRFIEDVLRESRKIINSFARVYVYIGYMPAGYYIRAVKSRFGWSKSLPTCDGSPEIPLPSWEQINACVPRKAGDAIESSNKYSVMAVAVDKKYVYMILASSIVPSSVEIAEVSVSDLEVERETAEVRQD